jgi:hypothetical protein
MNDRSDEFECVDRSTSLAMVAQRDADSATITGPGRVEQAPAFVRRQTIVQNDY